MLARRVTASRALSPALWRPRSSSAAPRIGIDVSTTFDPLTRFPAQATYLWDEAANQLPDDPRFNQMDTDS